ncbi:tRNA adenosine(34) deaminase TadA [Parasutterella sp.]|uniref:tRNA adenosine(34) deaminase TadA n=1 Tax=Parasutterella sp. TaxID=2049037 RepID=UPI003AB4D214
MKLSIRRGSSLASLSKSPEHLRTVVDAFRATARDPLDPDEEDAKKFLVEAGSWITDSAQNLLDASVSSPNEHVNKFSLSELTSAVEVFREEIRQKRKQQALSREEEVRLSRIDRSRDEYFMREALAEAEKAHQAGEVPVGAVVVDKEGRIIGRGHNLVVAGHDPSGHAEIIALRNASQNIKNYRLDNCAIYVTLEPCPMCSGAIIGARLTRLVYGAKDQKAGAVESVFKLFDERRVNHHTDVTAGVLEEDCLRMLRSFFVELRKSRGKSNG